MTPDIQPESRIHFPPNGAMNAEGLTIGGQARSRTMSEKHQQQAQAVYHDWRERCLANGVDVFISGVPHMEAAIAAALEAVERETAQRCAEIAGPSPWCEGMGGCCHDGCQERRKIAREIRTEFDKARAGKGEADAAE